MCARSPVRVAFTTEVNAGVFKLSGELWRAGQPSIQGYCHAFVCSCRGLQYRIEHFEAVLIITILFLFIAIVFVIVVVVVVVAVASGKPPDTTCLT